MRYGALFLLACLGCSGRREATKIEPAPPSSPPTVAPPVASATSENDAGTSDGGVLSDVGRFRPRVAIQLGAGVSCMAMLEALGVLPDGQAWFVGSCGLRFRVDATGKVDDSRAPSETTKFLFAGTPGTCSGTAAFWGVFARSEREAYVVGDTRCGLDPNTIWYRPIETFDGKKFQKTKVSFGQGPHDGIPWELSGNGELLYTLVEGDDWHGPPECAVHRFVKGAWGKAELECPMPKGPNDRVMVLKNLDVTHEGTLWVAGAVLMDGKPTSGMVWTRAKGEKAWTEIAVDDTELSNVSASADGGVFVAGRSLWKLGAGKFELISDGKDEVGSLWAQSRERIWLVRNGVPLVWSAGSERRVAVDPPDSVAKIHGSGAHVWAISMNQVWQLRQDDAATTPTVLTISEPKDP